MILSETKTDILFHRWIADEGIDFHKVKLSPYIIKVKFTFVESDNKNTQLRQLDLRYPTKMTS